MSNVVGDFTGANAMKDAAGVQKEQMDYLRRISGEDRAADLGIYNMADQEGFFDWSKRLKMYDDAVDPNNARDLENVGAAERAAGARPGDTNASAAIAMTELAQKRERGQMESKFFDESFKNRFAMRHAIGGNTMSMMNNAANTYAQTLQQQGASQMQGFTQMLTTGAQFAAMSPNGAGSGATAPPGGLPVPNNTNWGEENGGGFGGGMQPGLDGNLSAAGVSGSSQDPTYQTPEFFDRYLQFAA